jgi:3D-(3,5/4)-trihydroxycyclohexane-1,2-dione acylhydrolase (decyclizing)
VLDNGGFAVINKLQNNTGNESFNNLIADCPTVPEPFAVDFEAHAASMGATGRNGVQPGRTRRGVQARQGGRQDHVIVMKVDAYEGWTTKATPGGKSARRMSPTIPRFKAAHEEQEATRVRQRKGV